MKKLLLATAALAVVSTAAWANAPLNSVQPSGYYCEDRNNNSKHAWLFIDTKSGTVYWQVIGYSAYSSNAFTYMTVDIGLTNEFGHVVDHQPVIKELWWDEWKEHGKTRALKSFSMFPDRLDGHTRYGFGFYAGFEDINPAFSAECLPSDQAEKELVSHAVTFVPPAPPPLTEEERLSAQSVPTPMEYQRLVAKIVGDKLSFSTAQVLLHIWIGGDGTILKVQQVTEFPSNAVAANVVMGIKKLPAPPDGQPHSMTLNK